MTKLENILTLLKIFLKNKNEWFWNYKISLYLGILLIVYSVLYTVLGTSIISNLLLLMIKISICIHIGLSLESIVNDYIYNDSIKKVIKYLVYIILIKSSILLILI